MNQTDILSRATTYCEAAGISLSTLGVRALGNSRYFDRLQRRIDKTEQDEQKLAAFMAKNPPQTQSEAAE